MPLPNHFTPETPVCCPACNWRGKAEECLTELNDVLRCPCGGCGVAVVLAEPPPVTVSDDDGTPE